MADAELQNVTASVFFTLRQFKRSVIYLYKYSEINEIIKIKQQFEYKQ